MTELSNIHSSKCSSCQDTNCKHCENNLDFHIQKAEDEYIEAVECSTGGCDDREFCHELRGFLEGLQKAKEVLQ